MNKIIGGMIAIMAMMALSMGGASAAPLGGSQAPGLRGGDTMIVKVEGRFCRELRLSCENKERLGEAGMGNCRRYREECGGDRRSYCDRLRYKCNHKESLGQEGEGNCRRYRHECRGGW
jgi:hypothetical protein